MGRADAFVVADLVVQKVLLRFNSLCSVTKLVTLAPPGHTKKPTGHWVPVCTPRPSGLRQPISSDRSVPRSPPTSSPSVDGTSIGSAEHPYRQSWLLINVSIPPNSSPALTDVVSDSTELSIVAFDQGEAPINVLFVSPRPMHF
ncbi:hypothetical protein PGTUg99_035000 [Puccinia graminis f. sp. tritici]|uniref:Uncharacterized protein n=1 Tax=Puccinia graminis f. sp. tritici TaxID=56615 RepID=A0A5B0SDI3_PUCGR|nr:hypothetical protein PGTUg99_035000 [Puccinia graminis f. sp. tritici]